MDLDVESLSLNIDHLFTHGLRLVRLSGQDPMPDAGLVGLVHSNLFEQSQLHYQLIGLELGLTYRPMG